MKSLPLPVRVAAGLAVTAVEQARTLPAKLAGLPVTVASQALQVSMRVQQQVTELAIRGDEVLSALTPAEETPEWATFDEDLEDDRPDGARQSAFDRVTDDDVTVDDLTVDEVTDELTDAAARSAFNWMPGIDQGFDRATDEPGADQRSAFDRGTDEDVADERPGSPFDRVDEDLTDLVPPADNGNLPRARSSAFDRASADDVTDVTPGGRSSASDHVTDEDVTDLVPPADTGTTGATEAGGATDDDLTVGQHAPDTAGSDTPGSRAGSGKAGNDTTGTDARADDLSGAEAGFGRALASDDVADVAGGAGGTANGFRTPSPDPWTAEERAIAAETAARDRAQHDPTPDLATVENYDQLSLAQLRARLRRFSADQLTELLAYERGHENRPSFVGMLTRRIATVRDQT